MNIRLLGMDPNALVALLRGTLDGCDSEWDVRMLIKNAGVKNWNSAYVDIVSRNKETGKPTFKIILLMDSGLAVRI